jgi:hypothetical protein
MNMSAPERRADVPRLLVRRLRHLEFDEQRAGRIVADLHTSIDSAGNYLTRVLLWSRERCEQMLEGSLTHRRHAAYRELAALGQRASAVDTEVVETVDEDDGLVRWFADQEAAAQAAVAHAAANPVDADESDDEDVMLTLGGSTLTRSWRGGGTMRQR